MQCRTLDLTIISASGLQSVSNYKVYVDVCKTGGKILQTTPYLAGSRELTWNFPMRFTIDEAEGLKDGLHLVIKIMAVNWLLRKTLGRVGVSINDLMKGIIIDEGTESKEITYPIVNGNRENTGASLKFSYTFGRRFLHYVEGPYTTSGSNHEISNLELGEVLTAVVEVSAQGWGDGGGFDGGGCDDGCGCC